MVPDINNSIPYGFYCKYLIPKSFKNNQYITISNFIDAPRKALLTSDKMSKKKSYHL